MPQQLKKEINWLHKDKYRNLPNPVSVPEKDIKRILSGEPVDYVIGWKPFLNCKIDLSQKPLIPRPETEYWTEQFILSYKSKVSARGRPLGDGKSRKLRVLDMFAGSGCIGVAILKNIPNARVDFADYDPRCIMQIIINLKQNHIQTNHALVIRSDMFKNILTFCRILECKYDTIVANPPYIGLKDKRRVAPSVLKYEKRSAVFGGQSGLRYIEPFLRDAKKYLKPNGEIWMEFDTKEKSAIAALAKKFGYVKCEFRRDQYGKIRYAILT